MSRKFLAIFFMLAISTNVVYADEDKISNQKFVIEPIESLDLNSAGQPIVFPQKNGHVTVAVFDIPPESVLPVHEHSFPRMGYVLSGTLRVTNTETGKSQDYKSGAFIMESVGMWHKGENPAQEPLRLLVIDLIEKGAATTTLKQ